MEEETIMWFSVRLSRSLGLGLPWWLAIFLVLFVAIAASRERAWSHATEEEIARSVARSPEIVATPVEMTQRLWVDPPAFDAAADDSRTRLEPITNVLIALTAVMVVVSALLLTHG
jgi:hypothetical protein